MLSAVCKQKYYSSEDLACLDKTCLPKHISIIPDGNRRWAKNEHTQVKEGHRQGGDTLIETVKAAKELGIETITFYLFSTENWKRPQEEVYALMWLLDTFLTDQCPFMVEEGIRLWTIGTLESFPEHVQQTIANTKTATAHCHTINMVFALNYGGRDEICRAVKKIVDKCAAGELQKEQIDETTLSQQMDTAHFGDPDLWIRTSGEMRMSNFLLWQLSYAELYFSPVLWPDFQSIHLLDAVIAYQKRQRRWGGT